MLLSLSDGVRHHAQHKIGALWLRLSLDCVHLGRKDVALHVARLSLEQSQQLPLHASIKMQQRVVLLSARQQQQKQRDDDQKQQQQQHQQLDMFAALERLKAVKRERLTGTLLTRQAGRKSLFEV